MAKNPIKKHLFIRKEIHNHFPLYLILMVISLIFSLGFSTVGCIYSAMGNEDAIREKTVESYIQNANGFLIKNEYKDSFSDSDCFYTTQTCSECSVFLAYSNTVGGKLDGIFVSDDLGSHGIELASLSGKALGSYPKNANDVLLSSYSYDYAISYYQNRKELSDMSEAEDRFFTDNEIPFSKGLLHVSGFYKPFGNNLGRYEAAIEENSSAIGQSSFGFGLDSMFAASVDVLSGEDRIPFIPSTQSSKDAIEPEMIDSWLLDKLVFGIRGRNQVFVFAGEDEVQTLLKFNSCGYIVWLVVLIYVLYFMISFLAYGIREKRKILICRVLGESRNRQIISISFSSLLFSLAGFVLSLALLPLSLFVTEKAFTSHLLGVDIGLIRFSAVYPAIFFAVILVCEGFLLLLTSSWLSPKDLSKQLPALGEGN